MKRTTFNQVIHKALRDRVFMEALIKNPVKALDDSNLKLSKAQLDNLQKLLKKKWNVAGKNVLRFAYGVRNARTLPPPPPWMTWRPKRGDPGHS